MKKTIILVIPLHFRLYKLLVPELEKMNFKISLLFISDRPFVYKNFGQRISNFIRKTFLLKKDHKKKLHILQQNEDLKNQLSKLSEIADYALVFRPVIFNRQTLLQLKQKSKQMVGYQWDGLNRERGVFDIIELFDSFFVFDKEDYKQYHQRFSNLKWTANFYPEQINLKIYQPLNPKVFFVGGYLPDRMNTIIKIVRYLKSINIETDIRIAYGHKKLIKKYRNDITFINDTLSYKEALTIANESSVWLDFEIAAHTGISARTIESLFLRKKVITNNKFVTAYDFYHPNNIFVWNDKNIEVIADFLDKPYVPVNPEILKKYLFSDWIMNVLDIQNG